MQMYRREHYLAKLRPFYDDVGLIKVVTGIRRCGKSSLLCSVMDELRERGVAEGNICYINLDRREYQGVNTPEKLDAVIEHSLGKSASTDGVKKATARFSSPDPIHTYYPASLPPN